MPSLVHSHSTPLDPINPARLLHLLHLLLGSSGARADDDTDSHAHQPLLARLPSILDIITTLQQLSDRLISESHRAYVANKQLVADLTNCKVKPKLWTQYGALCRADGEVLRRVKGRWMQEGKSVEGDQAGKGTAKGGEEGDDLLVVYSMELRRRVSQPTIIPNLDSV